jgi:hypothetical protein
VADRSFACFSSHCGWIGASSRLLVRKRLHKQ